MPFLKKKKKKPWKQQYGLCKKKKKTDHIISSCSKTAQIVAKNVHWNVYNQYEFDRYRQDHNIESVFQNEHVKLLWNFWIQTN